MSYFSLYGPFLIVLPHRYLHKCVKIKPSVYKVPHTSISFKTKMPDFSAEDLPEGIEGVEYPDLALSQQKRGLIEAG